MLVGPSRPAAGDQVLRTASHNLSAGLLKCYRVGIRMNEPQMAALLVSHRRPGFYFRVLEEGEVGTGDETGRASPE
jgi:MOSC domain-containing protein YiiM